MTSHIETCEQFEMLISELVDGELNADDARLVRKHVVNCSSCLCLLSDFEHADSAVISSALGPNKSTASPLRTLSQNSRRLVWRIASLAAAAAALGAIYFAFSSASNPATARDFSPADYARPLKDLHVLNMQQEADQSLMLRTLSMDLRALKLELSQLEDSEAQVELFDEIDLMLARVKRFDSH